MASWLGLWGSWGISSCWGFFQGWAVGMSHTHKPWVGKLEVVVVGEGVPGNQIGTRGLGISSSWQGPGVARLKATNTRIGHGRSPRSCPCLSVQSLPPAHTCLPTNRSMSSNPLPPRPGLGWGGGWVGGGCLQWQAWESPPTGSGWGKAGSQGGLGMGLGKGVFLPGVSSTKWANVHPRSSSLTI